MTRGNLHCKGQLTWYPISTKPPRATARISRDGYHGGTGPGRGYGDVTIDRCITLRYKMRLKSRQGRVRVESEITGLGIMEGRGREGGEWK